MTRTFVPSGLPNLPGNSYINYKSNNFSKAHVLDQANGIHVVQDEKHMDLRKAYDPNRGFGLSQPAPPVAPAPGAPIKPGVPAGKQPLWVGLDRKVLRFEAYFKEAVVENRLENFRVRRCIVYYYLEDDSIHVSEPKIENSGIPHGEAKGVIFLKRHRIPKTETEFYDAYDFNIGKQVNFYGRVFEITECDNFTRSFLTERMGVEVPGQPTDWKEADEIEWGVDLQFDGNYQSTVSRGKMPGDPYNAAREKLKHQQNQNQKYFHPRPVDDDLMGFVEAKLGKMSQLQEDEKMDQFLKNDRKVLRFFLAWDDRNSLYGELRPFVLHYFLSDDTVEILEVQRKNSGRDPFPLFLKRQKLAKNLDTLIRTNAPTTHTNQLIDRTGKVHPNSMQYFKDTDFVVGKEVVINNAVFLIYSCDAFTRSYYKETYDVEFTDVPVRFEEDIERPQMELPPHGPSGLKIGAEEDALGSYLFLLPKVPKKNFRLMMDWERKIMRFMARFQDPLPQDSDRVFIIKYFLGDDTLAVYEPPQKNSGIMGTEFLHRCRVKKPGSSSEYYQEKDFFVGAEVELYKHKFIVYQADEYTLSHMETMPQVHPMSDLGYINAQLKPLLSENKAAVETAFKGCDPEDTGMVTHQDLYEILLGNGMPINDQVFITLSRRWDIQQDGRIAWKMLMNSVLS